MLPGVVEAAPLVQFDGAVPADVDAQSYGGVKALCEQEVAEAYASYAIVRPVIIARPLDTTDLFTY